MIRNYFLAAWRHFLRNGWISIINLFGLMLGLATCLVAGLYTKHELTTDRFHRGLDSLFRLTVKYKVFDLSGTPYPLADAMNESIPEVESALRTAEQETALRVFDDIVKETVVFADPQFFSFFSFALSFGHGATALQAPGNLVISHEVKMKYFPNDNPLGKIVEIKMGGEFRPFEISGVTAPLPGPSSIHFDYLLPLTAMPEHELGTHQWDRFHVTTFVRASPLALSSINAQVNQMVADHMEVTQNSDEKPDVRFIFHPFQKHHLGRGAAGAGLKAGRSPEGIWTFGGIALIILVLACINFLNLATAQSSRRAMEVGIRKVAGAAHRQLVPQFLFEAIVIASVAALLALGAAELALLGWKDLLNAKLSVFDAANIDILLGLLFVTVLAGTSAGMYPAFVLSGISPLQSFKSTFRIGGSNWLTRAVLSFQFFLSIVLVIAALAMWRQQRYITSKDLGYNEAQVLAIPIVPGDTSSLSFLQEEIKRLPTVVSTSLTSSVFTRGNSATMHQLPDGSTTVVYFQTIDENFVDLLEMELVAGRAFQPSDASDRSAIMINESLQRQLGLKDSVSFPLQGSIGHIAKPKIVGVVKDFHNNKLNYDISPILFTYNRKMHSYYLLAKLSEQQVGEGLRAVETAWKRVNPNSPFEFFFLDDDVQQQYDYETRGSTIVMMATLIAVFLSMLGLVGLAMFTAERRQKEIGIRKVFGASLEHIVMLLSKGYFWLVLGAFAVAAPVSYYLVEKLWLRQFAYRTEIGGQIFVGAFLLVLASAALAVGGQIARAALRNPSRVLKEE